MSVKFLQQLEPRQIAKKPQSPTFYSSKCTSNHCSLLTRQLRKGDR